MSKADEPNMIPSDVQADNIDHYFNVSRESIDKLKLYVDELLRWQSHINLISSSTIPEIWHRHICDGLQMAAHIKPTDRNIVDLGSGAGIPAIPLAIALQGAGYGARVIMIESNAKKASFLSQVIRMCKLDSRIILNRIESADSLELNQIVDVCTARALAPLSKLIDLSSKLPLHPQRMLFLKGQDVDVELTQATKCWNISFIKHSSRTQKTGCILEIKEVERVNTGTLPRS